ncbi:hypothetical protein M405DRAFT_824629 [Rhizopogon salebrosus TDB-379]|nr:hypothetical protein M405DRAFT_824629 [Rhizopogon salebrosus TDB-379]
MFQGPWQLRSKTLRTGQSSAKWRKMRSSRKSDHQRSNSDIFVLSLPSLYAEAQPLHQNDEDSEAAHLITRSSAPASL